MTEEIEDIFQLDSTLEFSHNRVKDDFIKVSPVTGTNINNTGTIRFELNNQQDFISLSDSFLVCEFSITKKDGTALGTDDITLENNAFPRCFNQMTLNIGGREIENITQSPGEASTIYNLIAMSDTYKRTYGQISGWFPDTGKGDNDVADIDYNSGYYWRKKIYNDKKKFTIMFPLKSIFGFTEYTKILSLLKITLSLIRKDDTTISAEVFYGAASTTGKIKFETLEWWIPSIRPSDEIQEIVTKRLLTKKPIDVLFMKRIMNQITIPTGANHSWNLGNYTNSVRFIFIGFKTTDAPTAQTNNALFTTHSGTDKITSMRIQMNNMYYPIDRMQMNFLDANIVEPYVAYVNCCQRFGNEPPLTAHEFKELYPIICFDVSSQSRTLKDNGINITLHIEKSSALTLNAYALVLEDCQYSIDVADGKMTRIN